MHGWSHLLLLSISCVHRLGHAASPHAWLLHTCCVAGLAPLSQRESATVAWELVCTQRTVRVREPPPQLAEHEHQAPANHCTSAVLLREPKAPARDKHPWQALHVKGFSKRVTTKGKTHVVCAPGLCTMLLHISHYATGQTGPTCCM